MKGRDDKMKTIKASEFGIVPETEIAEKLTELFKAAKENGCDKIEFDKGTYYINNRKCKEYTLYITNTVGDGEFAANETPHLNAVAFYLGGIDNLTVDGNGSIFIIDGKVTNAAVENCRNVTLKNMEIRHAHPDMHELKVVSKGAFYVDFEVDSDTQIEFVDSLPYFIGKDYCYPINQNAATARWIPKIKAESPELVKRSAHPLSGAFKFSKLDKNRFRAHYSSTLHFKVGDKYYIYDVRRQFAGIFINKSKNIKLENIVQRFNYSLALVVQNSADIFLENSVFAPEENSSRLLASCADFVQACMCRGTVSVSDCKFVGAGDDCLNAHGVHYKIVDVSDSQITVRYMHPQTHGFNPLRVGDEIAFVNPKTLLENGRAEILSSKLVSETDIRLALGSSYQAKKGEVIEDVTASPDVFFERNEMSRIITRGLLLTTRGKVRVRNNRFAGTTMSAILLSDDAQSWYESGPCRDVLIENNEFLSSGNPTILIKPENRIYGGAVHKNIRISGNTFGANGGCCVKASSTDGIELTGNDFGKAKPIKATKCENVIIK